MPDLLPTQRPLLIIEGDTEKLASQGLSCAERLARSARLLGTDPVVIQARSTADLLSSLGRVAPDTVFDAIILIGHGNADGIVLARDRELVSWKELADWLEELEPERLALICCQAGRTLAANSLFDGLGQLDEVYASPLNMSMLQSRAIDFLLPALLDAELDEGFIRLVQAGQMLLTRGFLFRWTRERFESSDEWTDVIATTAEGVLVPVGKELLDSLLSGPDGDEPQYLPARPHAGLTS